MPGDLEFYVTFFVPFTLGFGYLVGNALWRWWKGKDGDE